MTNIDSVLAALQTSVENAHVKGARVPQNGDMLEVLFHPGSDQSCLFGEVLVILRSCEGFHWTVAIQTHRKPNGEIYGVVSDRSPKIYRWRAFKGMRSLSWIVSEADVGWGMPTAHGELKCDCT